MSKRLPFFVTGLMMAFAAFGADMTDDGTVLPAATLSSAGGGETVTVCLGAKESAAQTIAHCTSASEIKGLPDQQRAAVMTQRGLARMSSGELNRALEDFDAAIRLNGDSSWAYNARAVVWAQKGDIDRAISDYRKAVQLRPGYAFAWANLGSELLVKGDVDAALASLNEAIRLAPQRVEIALSVRGRAWLAKRDYSRALDDFEEALKVNPKYANAMSGRAFVHFCRGEFDAAANDFMNERRVRKDVESAVDLILALRRGGHDAESELADIMKEADASQGLAPGIALLSGKLTPEQSIQATTDRDPKVRRQRLCTASFEVGEWYLLQPDVAQARQYLALARDNCDPSQSEYSAAGAELDRFPERP